MRYIMRVLKNIIILVLMFTCNAAATIIPDDLTVDFRDAEWQPANGAPSYTSDDKTVTVTACGYHSDLIGVQSYILNQDYKDGLGIRTYKPNGEQKDEIDEINMAEYLNVSIQAGALLSGVWITDLFDHEPGYNENFGEDEYGHLILNGTTIIDFGANNNGQYPSGTKIIGTNGETQNIGTNGELWVSFEYDDLIFSIDF